MHFEENNINPPLCDQYDKDITLQGSVHEFWCIPFDRVDDHFLTLWFDSPISLRPKISYLELAPFADIEHIDWASSLVDICQKDQVRMFKYVSGRINTVDAQCNALLGCAKSKQQLCTPFVLRYVTCISPYIFNIFEFVILYEIAFNCECYLDSRERFNYRIMLQLTPIFACGPLAALLIEHYDWIRSYIYQIAATNKYSDTIEYLDAHGYKPAEPEPDP